MGDSKSGDRGLRSQLDAIASDVNDVIRNRAAARHIGQIFVSTTWSRLGTARDWAVRTVGRPVGRVVDQIRSRF